MAEAPDVNPDTPTAAARPAAWRSYLWPDWSARKRMLRIEACALVLASYVLLLLAYLLPQDYRNESPGYVLLAWAAFLVHVLQFHLGLLLMIVALVAAFGRGRRLFLAAMPPALFTLVPALVAMFPRTPPTVDPGATVVRVMSCNLLMINTNTAPILAEIRAARPDVLLLQEYTVEWHDAVTKAGLSEEMPYSSFVTRDDSFGVAIYSRHPFVGEVDNRLPLGRAGVEQTRAVVRVGGRDIAVYNIHLLPPRRLDYTIDSRLQFAGLLDELKRETLPYVVGGDFNLTGDTPQHRDLRAIGAIDAHDAAGRGRGATWPVNSFFRYLPGLRLDHVYVGNGVTVLRCETGEGRGSDHRPVIADVAPAVTAPATGADPARTGGATPVRSGTVPSSP